MLDKLNQRLIQELQNDGRTSNRVLARKLGVSEGTIRKRISDLRSRNVIKIVAQPDPYRLGCRFICIMGLEVKLADLHAVGEELAQCPNVYYLAHVTGAVDLMAILLFRDSEGLADFIRDKISKIPSILKTQTFVNMDIVKSPWVEALDVMSLLASGD
ncbi:Lrp/AsnC family transcriptional regulator [Dehalococcoidia bacterium]|nr:Lrp/AsnC family transcriptional regulator [Dehalococcoidia bacterium]MCL0092652.1 Lrp/AsnC family transcriptional regulator [Dehalococcoidia bacterium]